MTHDKHEMTNDEITQLAHSATAERISGNEEIQELMSLFFDDVEKWVEGWWEMYGASKAAAKGIIKPPWRKADPAIWAIGFYYDPDRSREDDGWELMEFTENCPINMLRLLEELGCTKTSRTRAGDWVVEPSPEHAVWDGLLRAAVKIKAERTQDESSQPN
jgi:hypothetical protein